jgi:ABC-type amino acid transport substrate-binding protein
MPVNPPLPDRELVIATREVPPFAIKRKDGSWHGISIALWHRIAERLHLRYRFSEQTTNQEILDGVAKGTFDAGIAAITITAARERIVDFTLRYYTAGLGVAVSTGEHAPATLPGRLVAIGWMIASVIAVAVFTAGVTSALTQREMQGVVHDANDLRHVRVGAVANSPTVTYLDRERISHRTFPTALDALKTLEAGELDAFVHDKPLLTWLVLQDFSAKLRVLAIVLQDEHYAIALPKFSTPLHHVLNAPLLEETETDWWDQTVFQYLGKRQPN